MKSGKRGGQNDQKRRTCKMKSLSKKFIEEWQFFIDPITKKLSYNDLCKDCINDCKQSYRVEIIYCKEYEKKVKEER